MRTTIIVTLLISLGTVGCTGMLDDLKKTNETLAAPKKGLSTAPIDVIGAPGDTRCET